MRTPRPIRFTAIAVLISYLHLLCPLVPLLAAAEAPPSRFPTIAADPLVRTPEHVQVNRVAPANVGPVSPSFSRQPTEQEIFLARVLPEPFVPSLSLPKPAETKALADAISVYLSNGATELTPFVKFVEQFPDSAWSASVRLNLGLVWFANARFTHAISAYDAAWQQTKSSDEPKTKVIADRSIAELTQMYARLGRMDMLAKLFGEIEGRVFTGTSSELVAGARAGYALMQQQPELAFRCGPAALGRILSVEQSRVGVSQVLFDAKSTVQGINLTDVWHLSQRAGMQLQMARRETGAQLITPAVIHWKVGHYAALFAEGTTFRLEDPTFGPTPMRATAGTIDEEGSGYFLVPIGALPSGWSTVSEEEGRTVWGRGTTNTFITDRSTNHDKKADPDCPTGGMAVANVLLMLVSLNLTDTPVGYSPPKGPSVAFTVTYNQVEASQPTTPDFSNLGSKWVHNWLSFIDEGAIPGSGNAVLTAALRPPGGGTDRFSTASMPVSPLTYPYSFLPQADTQANLQKTNATTFVLTKPDGSQVTYGRRTGAVGSYRYFMTQVADPMGQAVTLSYDAQNRLASITDALGQVTTFSYTLAGDALKITKVTDPFGRYATFDYDASMRLQKITDVLGLQSQFGYSGATDFISTLTTPYGISTFAYGTANGGRDRWLELVDPMGDKQRVECQGTWSPGTIPGIGTQPTGMNTFTGSIQNRNTLYWSKKAWKDSPNQISSAHIYHFCHSGVDFNSVSGTLEMEKPALESWIFYNYPGQSQPYQEGTSSQPSVVGRVLDDGSTQLTKYEYNSFGQPTKFTDPLGRVTTFIYAANGIDVTETRQKTGPNVGDYEVLSKGTYNAQHLPLTVTDPAGQVTALTYNTAGQPSTTTNAKGEVVHYYYDASGYLTSVDGPLAGSSDTTTFAYDGYGRMRTVTDSDGYAVTSDYDVFNRPTVVTYPDSTYNQVTYSLLDAVKVRDRRGLITSLRYNSVRQVVTSTDPLGRATQFTWCKCGALRLLVDPSGNLTSWTHDVEGRVTSKKYADGNSVTYAYETNTARPKSVTDAKAQVTSYQYFTDNALKQVSYTNATVATPTVSYTYDPNYLRVATMVDGVGTIAYAYNPIPVSPTLGAGRLASIDGPLANDTISYAYDELGRALTQSINGAANQTTSVYDALGRVTSITNPLGAFAYNYVNATSRLDHVIYPNSQRTNYAYLNNAGDQRLQQIQNLKPDSSNLSTFVYTYDAQGIIQTLSKQIDAASALVSSFKYDSADQLTEAVVPTSPPVVKNYVYRYDLVGNRTSEQIEVGVTSATHNSVNQIASLSATGPIRFEGSLNETGSVTINGKGAPVAADNSFKADVTLAPGSNIAAVVVTDPANNTVTKNYQVTVAGGSARTLTYDLNGNLLNDGASKTYDWDAVDRLVKITLGSGVTEFVYDGQGRRVREKLNGTVVKQWVWSGGAQPCEERDAGNAVTKRFYGGGEQIGGTAYYFSTDHLGSIREMTDSSGTIRARYDYDPYGRITKISGDLESDFGFTGFYRHQASGLNLTLYRAYDSDLGRWLSRDPIGENSGINLYCYVANNPVNAVDPLGLRDVYVRIWNAKYPYIGDGGSVGHVLVTETNGALILSQFPDPHGRHGTNTPLDLPQTLAIEGERQPDLMFKIFVPNDAEFDAAAATERAMKFWDYNPDSKQSETNCVQAADNAFSAGGVPVSSHLLPGYLGDKLTRMSKVHKPGQAWSVTPMKP